MTSIKPNKKRIARAFNYNHFLNLNKQLPSDFCADAMAERAKKIDKQKRNVLSIETKISKQLRCTFNRM